MKEEGKLWRFSRKKFYKKLDLFLDQELDKYINQLNNIENLTKFQKDILKKCVKAKKEHFEINSSKSLKYIYRMNKIKAISNNINEWSEFSMKPENLEDIAFRLIIFEKFKISLCCVSYICQYSSLPEDFIDDMIYITSGQFSFTKWDDEHVQSVVKSLETHNFKDEELHKLFPGYDGHQLHERIDWKEIYRYQKISTEFAESHKPLLLAKPKK